MCEDVENYEDFKKKYPFKSTNKICMDNGGKNFICNVFDCVSKSFCWQRTFTDAVLMT